MVIPAYREVDLALLVELVRRGSDATPSEMFAAVPRHFPLLTGEDMAKTRERTGRKVINNMIRFARNHLRVRGVLDEAPAGIWRVNGHARGVLLQDLVERGVVQARVESFLGSDDTLGDLLGPDWAKEVSQATPVLVPDTPPERSPASEAPDIQPADSSLKSLEQTRQALLERLNQMEGYDFEQFVGRLLDSLGFLDTQVVGRSGDEGIDVMTYLASPFLRAKVVVQVKRHNANVGPKDISYLRDRWAHRADKLLFITTSDYTAGAREVAAEDREKQVELVSGQQLVDVMLENRFGVKTEPVFNYELDEEYFTGF